MKNKQKKRAPIIVLIIVSLFSLCYIVGTIVLIVRGTISLFTAALVIIAYLVLLVGIIKAFRERMKEIDGGEEDEALKY